MTSAELVTRTTTTALAGLEGPRWETVAGAWLASYASENTRAAYRRDLAAFTEHLAEKKNVLDLGCCQFDFAKLPK
jgi:hypothetical protein